MATFGGGCFWCLEALFQKVPGVEAVESGYSGGALINPTYKEICSGLTGHAEVVKIKFDPDKVTYGQLLKFFFAVHNPTIINPSDPKGSQYRSIILFHDEKQRQQAEDLISELMKESDKPIYTELIAFKNFFKAEEYHQNYYLKDPTRSYCQKYIDPKLRNLGAILNQIL